MYFRYVGEVAVYHEGSQTIPLTVTFWEEERQTELGSGQVTVVDGPMEDTLMVGRKTAGWGGLTTVRENVPTLAVLFASPE
jgi:hypothetical protein